MDFKSLKERYQTPLYVFNCDQIKERISYLKNKLPNMEICYAIKANSFIIDEIKNDIDRIEICSYGEYLICDELNINANKMVLSGVNKNYEEFENIFKNDKNILRFTIESLVQFELLKDLSNKYQKQIDILPRLTSGNQFGITLDEIKTVIKEKNEFMSFKGIEFFSGTQKHSLSRIEKEFNKIVEVVNELETEFNFNIEEIEYGTGFPVYYFQGDEFDEESFFDSFNELVKTYLSNKKVVLEIGRSLVASSGYYLTSVVDKKCNKTGNYVILDGGINQIVYYGQSMAMKIPHYEIIGTENSETEVVNLCGSLCTVNDLIVKQLECKKLDLGDTFVFKNVGAYSVTEGISLFLSRDLPKVVLISNNEEKIVRDLVNTYKINKPNYGGK